MHWLRDLMRESPRPLRSLGALARLALAHPGWPVDSKPQARSLAALLSKLDRGVELDWLGDRPAVQHVLADVLGVSPSRLTDVVGSGLSRLDQDTRRVRFTDVPFAAPLDLASEPLPPGIPMELCKPADWGRARPRSGSGSGSGTALWWRAGRGAGRSLLGAWLAARGLATFVSARNWEEARPRVPESGPVYVELWGAAADPDAERDALALEARGGLCIAAACPPPSSRHQGPGPLAFHTVESAPPEEWLEDLVRWLALRLPKDGHFPAASALESLKRADREGLVDGLGTALGLAGLDDATGGRQRAAPGAARTTARFVRERLAAGGQVDRQDTTWLEKNGVKILVGLATAALTDAGAPWDAPRSEVAWMGLIPAEYRDSVDAEWVRQSLSHAAAASTVKDVEKALRELPPGPFRVTRAFVRAGLLRPEGSGDELVLGPAWLSCWAYARAREGILHGGPLGWGDALLSTCPGWVVRGVTARVLEGDTSVLEEALDLENPRDPGAIAAFELAFRAGGLALVAGVELPPDLRRALFEQQLRFVVERPDGPHPRIGYGRDLANAEPLLHVGVFRLAALSLSEELTGLTGSAASGLVPTEPPARARLLDSIWDAVTRQDLRATPWALAALDLAPRVRPRAQVMNAAEGAPHEAPSDAGGNDAELRPLEWPHTLLARAASGTLTWTALAAAGPEALSAALALAARRETDVRAVIQACWLAWVAAKVTLKVGTPLSPTSRDAWELYAAAPPEALRLLFSRLLVDRGKVPYTAFDASQWHALLGADPHAVWGISPALPAMPPEIVRVALAQASLDDSQLADAFRREPALVLDALADALLLDAGRAAALLAAAPRERTAEVVAKLLEFRTLMPESALSEEARSWLHERASERAPGFRTAIALLDDGPG